MPFYLPNILLAIPRNPVTAVGLPLALGCLSGLPASKVENSNWYFVGPMNLIALLLLNHPFRD